MNTTHKTTLTAILAIIAVAVSFGLGTIFPALGAFTLGLIPITIIAADLYNQKQKQKGRTRL